MKNHDSASEKMYREHILELYKNPSNFGEMKSPQAWHNHSHLWKKMISGSRFW